MTARFLPWTRTRSLKVTLAATLSLLLASRISQAAESTAASEPLLRENVTYLASDELEGRGVGTAGLDKAASYLAHQFQQIGLKTDLFGGSPFQEFEITVAAELGPTERNKLTLIGPADTAGKAQRFELKLGESFTPLAAGGTGKFAAPLVFAGYGITAKDLKRGDKPFAYDDFAGLDVKNKVVVLIRKEPQQKDEQSPFDGARMTDHATFKRKLENAAEHGAAAVIVVNDGLELTGRREQDAKLLQVALDKLAELREKVSAAKPNDAGYEKLAAEVTAAAGEAVELSKSLAAGADGLLPFTGAGETSRQRQLPVYFCTRTALNPILQAAVGKNLQVLEQEIDDDLTPRSAVLAGWQAVGETSVVEKKATVKNVVGVLEGEGPLADETIVVGAHYDHLGFGGSGSLAPWTHEIHNGADDNASGTATLLDVARRLASGPNKPRRRIVFIAFTGEERGLWGSARYTREPRFPLEKTIAMFNLDMVGRLTDDKLMVYGTGTAKEFDSLIERQAQEHGFKLTKDPSGYGPSDHDRFYAKKIPVLHLFTGTHSDYHRPSDDAEKLNITGMRRVAEILVDLVQATDASEQRPTYVEIRSVANLGPAGPEGDRPSFGSMPAYPNPVPDGVLLEAVMPGSPAEKAGVKGGDILVKLGESKITILEDFESALRKHKPGDKVKATIRRGTELIELDVTLGRRRTQ
jgi:hypothetical protein